MSLATELSAIAADLGLGDRDDKLQIYLREILLWNPKLGLLEAEGRDILVRHFLDVLAPWRIFRALCPPGSPCADIGSGAGFPGIPLAMALPDTTWTLVEKQGRRCGFLLNVKALAGLGGVDVRQERLESQPAGTFAVATCRAFTPLHPDSLAELRRILRPDGLLVLYKARRDRIDEELAACGLKGVVRDRPQGSPDEGEGLPPPAMDGTRALIVPVDVPGLDEERHLVIIGKG